MDTGFDDVGGGGEKGIVVQSPSTSRIDKGFKSCKDKI